MKKGRETIKKGSLVPRSLRNVILSQEITSDYVLEIYEKAKRLDGKKRDELLSVAEKLSKHIGKWLTE